MARGVLSGLIWGTVAAGLGAGALSLATEVPGAKPPNASVQAPEAGQDSTAAIGESPDVPTAPTEDSSPAARTADAPDAPSAETSTAETDTDAAPKPNAGDTDVTLVAPQAPETAGVALSETGDATVDTQASGTLNAPEAETDPNIENTPAARPAPETAEVADAPQTEDETTADADAGAERVPDEEREEVVIVVPSAPDASPAPEQGAEADTDQAEARVSIGTPARRLGSAQSNSLPSIGSDGDSGTDAAQASSLEQVDISELPPVERFAEPFAPEEDTPKMAIVLIDDGTSDIGVEALTTFPYPLSFAVDTTWDGAEDAMAKYRSQGFEVLAMVNLPSGARAADVEVSMPVLLGKVPEAVGVMETPDAGLQSSRDVIAQVSEFVRDSGHGLLLFPKGLNTAQKLAAKEGVPSATVFRDFDGKGQNAGAIKRFLSHAVLKADSEGGVVMVGRLRADTISALLLWGLQERGDRVQLAPVSQLLVVPGQG